MALSAWLINLATIYAAIGFIFALVFVGVGVGRIDPAAQGAPWSFRLLILPGVAALWPLLLRRWLRGPHHPPIERNPHRERAQEVTR